MTGISHNAVPPDLRRYSGRSCTEKSSSVDQILNYCYWNLAPWHYFFVWNFGHCISVVQKYVGTWSWLRLFLGHIPNAKAEALVETVASEEMTGAAVASTGIFLPCLLAISIRIFRPLLYICFVIQTDAPNPTEKSNPFCFPGPTLPWGPLEPELPQCLLGMGGPLHMAATLQGNVAAAVEIVANEGCDTSGS